MSEPKPFHEVVVDAILCCSGPKLEFLASIINATKIPKNHDLIINAWRTRSEEMGWDNEDQHGVIAHVSAQKELHQKKIETNKETCTSTEATIQ